MNKLRGEHDGFEFFRTCMEPVGKLFDERGVTLMIERCTPLELAARLEKTPQERDYLQRYA